MRAFSGIGVGRFANKRRYAVARRFEGRNVSGLLLLPQDRQLLQGYSVTLSRFCVCYGGDGPTLGGVMGAE